MTLQETLAAAVADLAENGFDSMERIDGWLRRIRAAAEAEMTPPGQLEELINRTLRQVYARQVEQGGFARLNPGVERFTVERLRPALRAQLDRRVMASAQLIRMNREAAVQRTLQRFSGWATSIPAGGSDQVDRREVKKDVRKPLASLPFHERRVAIDQGAKLTAALSETLAVGTGALAGRWHSRWRVPNYDYRTDHKERDPGAEGHGHVYVVPGSWALERGLITKGHGLIDTITRPGEEPYCRCHFTWLYNLRDLPPEMLTRKGAEELERVRIAIRAHA